MPGPALCLLVSGKLRIGLAKLFQLGRIQDVKADPVAGDHALLPQYPAGPGYAGAGAVDGAGQLLLAHAHLGLLAIPVGQQKVGQPQEHAVQTLVGRVKAELPQHLTHSLTKLQKQ